YLPCFTESLGINQRTLRIQPDFRAVRENLQNDLSRGSAHFNFTRVSCKNLLRTLLRRYQKCGNTHRNQKESRGNPHWDTLIPSLLFPVPLLLQFCEIQPGLRVLQKTFDVYVNFITIPSQGFPLSFHYPFCQVLIPRIK